MKILLATKNQGKLKEIREIFQGSSFEIIGRDELPTETTQNMEIEETAQSFEGNALIKAIVLGEISGFVTLADDSGLCVEALNGAPGVNSARYSGGGDKENNLKLLGEMAGQSEEKRDAHYQCVVAIYDPTMKKAQTVFGRWDGRIALEMRGDKSFGYAPVFLPREFGYKVTTAELDNEEIIKINHRGQAFRQARKILEEKYS
ncbi:MAG TPA: RdgB/HAM1 family non-canonical purine NTP pyrophosphatase [Patescibacteria group bacterium]|nr:RdgB/HAM1 family non-canonical purine NTP pyrophosphatase [Patescibacteria group bacterium]